MILENNMKEKTIIAYCFIKDSMITNELLPDTFEINNDLILLVKNARGRYQQKWEENKSCKEKNDKEKQSALLQEEIDVVKKKNSDTWKSCSMHDEECVNSMMQKESKNTLKRKSKEMKSGIRGLEEALQTLQEKRKKISY